MIKISQTSKLNARSWSLQALDTCPGSWASPGELVDACKGCYATTGNYNYPNVKAPRLSNREDWQRLSWVDDMVTELDSDRYFRWFDSGDVYTLGLAEKILEVMIRTPWVNHWLPTRMHKFHKFSHVFAQMQALQFDIADMKTRIEATRMLIYKAAYLKSAGLKYGTDSAIAKLFAAETAMFVTTKAVQLHGGYGYTKDYPVERMMRDAKITEIYEGTSEVQRMVIAASVLGK